VRPRARKDPKRRRDTATGRRLSGQQDLGSDRWTARRVGIERRDGPFRQRWFCHSGLSALLYVPSELNEKGLYVELGLLADPDEPRPPIRDAVTSRKLHLKIGNRTSLWHTLEAMPFRRDPTSRNTQMQDQHGIHRSAADAWKHLVDSGALDVNGRDKEFADSIWKMLDPAAATLHDALSRSTTEDLIQVFFQALQPFSEMYREILKFYRLAGARYGKEQWKIAIDDQHLELSDFEDFLRLWDSVPSEIEVPTASKKDFDALWRACEAYPPQGDLAKKAARETAVIGVASIDRWLSDYRSGLIGPLPSSLIFQQKEAGFRELASVIAAVHETSVTFSADRRLLRGQFNWKTLSASDAFSINHLAFLDTDNWLGCALAMMALAEHLDAGNRARIACILRETYEGLPTRKLRASVSLNDLDRFLSLPAWKQRHEIYAVWIFTEMVSAAKEHDLELHHDHGRIEFAFRETRLATVTSARQPMDLVTERRSPLANPVGAGRTGNVQPDFSIWARAPAGDRRVLVVEVKHYKRTAKKSFSEVMTDYAAAHMDAQVVLVNYGPIGDILDRVPAGSRKQCVAVEMLAALNRSGRQRFHDLVQAALGPPIRPALVLGGTASAKSAIAVDISGSMAPALREDWFHAILANIAVAPHAAEIYPIDLRVHEAIPVDKAASHLRNVPSDVNALEGPVRELLGMYEEVIVLTDRDGVDDLNALTPRVEQVHEDYIFKATVRRAP